MCDAEEKDKCKDRNDVHVNTKPDLIFELKLPTKRRIIIAC